MTKIVSHYRPIFVIFLAKKAFHRVQTGFWYLQSTKCRAEKDVRDDANDDDDDDDVYMNADENRCEETYLADGLKCILSPWRVFFFYFLMMMVFYSYIFLI